LGEVDADLVRPARFQPTGDEGVPRAQRLHALDVGDGRLAAPRSARAAAPAVATVADQPGADRLRGRPAGDHGQVPPADRVRMELLAQLALREGGAGEDNQPARELV